MKFNMGIKLYLRQKDYGEITVHEDLIKKIHECIVDSVEMKNDVLQQQNTKLC